MTLVVRISGKAAEDLQAIGDFIACADPAKAAEFIASLKSHFDYIRNFPNAFPLDESIGVGIRILNYQNYKIFYSNSETGVLIERVVHGRRVISPSS